MKRSVLGLVVATLAFAACGGGDSDSKDTGKTKSAESGKGEAGSSGITCGAEHCTLPSALKGQELCCTDKFTGSCGIKMGANCRKLPKMDERCPTPDLNVMIPGMGNIIDSTFGCCTSNNECGVDFGAGCQPRTIACMVVSADMVDKIKPQTCDGKELPLPAMCGTSGFMIPMFPGAAGSGN